MSGRMPCYLSKQMKVFASVSFQNIARDEIILLNFVHLLIDLYLILLKTFFIFHNQNQVGITSDVIIIKCIQCQSNYIYQVSLSSCLDGRQ
ncbi:hypothetical protein FGO68_gene12065 [Halteria grandinella]|uniref:Uncharacterized protein n=1 Tax=Halteria grandinella TaxID=5974 RepID=A0A8J8NUY9_HALGN|nr:hypothetical protein FGO68_gene12065 [Halteria grandinella]